MEEKKTAPNKMTKKQDEAVKKALKAEAERHHKELVEKENKLAKVAKVPPNDSFIILKDVNKIYDNHVQAVFNFNLEIKQKEFIVFVGPSGCGKSTTLRMIAGLEDITYGDLFIDGKYCNLTPPKDRNLAMVFQNYALYPHMNVYSNMAFGIKIRKVKTPIFEPNQRLNDLCKERDGITKKLNKVKDDQNLISSYQAKIDELNLLIKEEEKNRKPIMFIDKAMIKYLTKEIEKNEKTVLDLKAQNDPSNEKIIEKVNKSIEKAREDLQFYTTNQVQKYKYAHLPKEEIDARVQNAARILNLEPYLDRKPSAMSGGQRQRVALGRAIVRNAKVLLMDEPLSNLDAKLRVQMRSEIAQLHQRIGSTTIYVTHDQTEAMTMADRIVVMKDGHVQQIDTPSQIYDHPSNTFVAGFIGSPAMNIFKASVKANTIHLPDCFKIEMLPEQVKTLKTYIEEQTKVLTKKVDNIKNMLSKLNPENQSDKGNYELLKKREAQYLETLERFAEYKKGKNLDVEFGIRAEDIISGPDMIKFKKLSLPYKALVTVAEFLGHEYFIHYDFGEAPIVAKVPVTKNLIKAGDKVEVKINKEKIHLFEFGSKETIF